LKFEFGVFTKSAWHLARPGPAWPARRDSKAVRLIVRAFDGRVTQLNIDSTRLMSLAMNILELAHLKQPLPIALDANVFIAAAISFGHSILVVRFRGV
jgi:hypothetical protein